MFQRVEGWRAREGLAYTESLGIRLTALEGFSVHPTRPAVDDPVSISGRLLSHTVLCVWGAFAGAQVHLIVNDEVAASTTTATDGAFSFTHRFTKTGVYRVKARFIGDLINNPCESPVVEVTVLTKEEKEAEERNFWLMVGGIAAVAVVAVGGVAYYVEESRRREMLMATLARR